MSAENHTIHKRKSSKDEEDIIFSVAPAAEVEVPEANEFPSVTISSPPPRSRTQSTPHTLGHNRTISAGGIPPPFRPTFSPRPLNGHSLASPLRSSFSPTTPPPVNGHYRTRSISTPFMPILPSPLSSSFQFNSSSHSPTETSPTFSSIPPNMTTSQSAPEASVLINEGLNSSAKHNRRHSRMHSRNLSLFFPHPGSLPQSAIAEDGSQEVEVAADAEAPLIPPAGSSVNIPGSRRQRQTITPLGQGFTFGGKPPSSASLPTPEPMSARTRSISSSSSTSQKRGHHHKHSLSHNLFSFLADQDQLHTQPTPLPVSPWGPISAFPDSSAPTTTGFTLTVKNGNAEPPYVEPEGVSSSALAASVGQFGLGSWLWVTGQQIGSLSCTGLGYWVVFDSFGVALDGVIPGCLASQSTGGTAAKNKEKFRRPYGNGRVETVLMFAQAVYLMFSSVYVCKETVEHVLLSANSGDGHHHHHGDEDEALGIDFPIFMTFFTFISILATAIIFQNNTKIVNITGNRIPSWSSIIRSIWSPTRHAHEPPPSTRVQFILSNPFISIPLFICLSILFVSLFLQPPQHRMADLFLATIITALTFKVAYRASVVLGTVLLQTSPPRGLSSGKMEAFLRAMREVERHPHVLHLPAPHIWQLTPSLSSSAMMPTATSPTTASFSQSKSSLPSDSLVVTMELHVREDLPDDDVLKLTRWAWERCVSALWSLKEFREPGEEGGPEITVGVVRG